MSAERFKIVDRNPNEDIGGGGCLCSPTKTDCVGPFAVFYGMTTDSNVSPHVVIGVACAEAVVRQAHDQAAPTDAELVEIVTDDREAELARLLDEQRADDEPPAL